MVAMRLPYFVGVRLFMAISGQPSAFSGRKPDQQWDLGAKSKQGNPFATGGKSPAVAFGASSATDTSKAGLHMAGFLQGLSPQFNLLHPAHEGVSFVASA
jgi:hypothetical protein